MFEIASSAAVENDPALTARTATLFRRLLAPAMEPTISVGVKTMSNAVLNLLHGH